MSKREISGSFDIEMTAVNWDELVGLIGSTKSDMEFVLPRRWRERLFSIPWRPWLNVVVYHGHVAVTDYTLNSDGTATVTTRGVGKMGQTLERR